MLFTEQDLSMTNAMDILNEANYLSESESMINPKTIPVKEVSRIGYGVVRFDDVDRLAENYGCDYIDAMYAIAEASDMNPEYLAVAVPEEEIIAYPEIVNELANIVIQPLSEDSFAYKYVDMCLEAWDNTGDEDYLEAIVEDYCLEEAAMILNELTQEDIDQLQAKNRAEHPELYEDNQVGLGKSAKEDTSKTPPNPAAAAPAGGGGRLSRYWNSIKGAYGKAGSDIKAAWGQEGIKNKATALGKAAWGNKAVIGGTAAGVAGLGAAIYAGQKYIREARNKPKSWIGKKIAALRSVYQKWMQAAQKNPQKAGAIKSAAAKLLAIIDALLAKMQKAAG